MKYYLIAVTMAVLLSTSLTNAQNDEGDERPEEIGDSISDLPVSQK